MSPRPNVAPPRPKPGRPSAVPPAQDLHFMGQVFPTLGHLRAAYPAFGTDDAVRAIRAGCDTPTAVETYCWKFRNATYLKTVAAARASRYSARHMLGERDMAAKRRRGGLASAARGKAKPAGRKA